MSEELERALQEIDAYGCDENVEIIIEAAQQYLASQKQPETNEVLNLLLDETEGLAICITNEDLATDNDVREWVDCIVENIETIRTTLTKSAEHLQAYKDMKEATQQYRTAVRDLARGLRKVKSEVIDQNGLEYYVDEFAYVETPLITHAATIESAGECWATLSSRIFAIFSITVRTLMVN